MREKDIEDTCCRMARQYGVVAVKLEHCGHKGIPDRMFVARGGRCLFVEFKTPIGKQSANQRTWAEFLGNSHVVCRSTDEFSAALLAFLQS